MHLYGCNKRFDLIICILKMSYKVIFIDLISSNMCDEKTSVATTEECIKFRFVPTTGMDALLFIKGWR